MYTSICIQTCIYISVYIHVYINFIIATTARTPDRSPRCCMRVRMCVHAHKYVYACACMSVQGCVYVGGDKSFLVYVRIRISHTHICNHVHA